MAPFIDLKHFITNPLKVGQNYGSKGAEGVTRKAYTEQSTGWGNVIDRIGQINCEVEPKAACRYKGGDGTFDMHM